MGKRPLERDFQLWLKKQLKAMFPGCIILKNDPGFRTGIPDLIVLWEGHWALLEVKRGANEKPRPLQPYYVTRAQEMSFGAFIYPENAEEVLNALQRSFSS